MKAKVRANGVLVRQSNSNMSPVIGSVSSGAVLDIEAEYGEWVKLTSGGWVKTCYTEAIEVSGGASSWNDLEDKPFYEESGVVEVLAECQPTFAEGFFVLDDIAIVAGETYTVNWNNVAYECVAQDAGAPVLGNMSVFEGPNSGEPFAIVQEGAWIAIALDGATELTLSIYQNSTVVHTIDPKYLPELPWLKITYDGTSYAANMTYAEAVALLDSKSLLGGCYIEATGTVNQMSVIEDFRQGEEAYIHCIASGKQYRIYADGFVTEASGDK